MSRLIEDYLQKIEFHLGFDRKLAHRIREDVQDHLWETLDRHDVTQLEAEARTIAGFGEPHEVARTYCEAVLPNRLRATWVTTIFLAVATLVFMRLRGNLLGADSIGDLSVLTLVDRAGFAIGLLGTLATSVLLFNSKSRCSPRQMQSILTLSFVALSASIVASLGRAANAFETTMAIDIMLIVSSSAFLEIGLLFWVAARIHAVGRYASLDRPHEGFGQWQAQ